MNSVILIGRLARDPELSYTANTQTALCRMTVAVDRGKRNGEDLGADFIDVTVWDRQAENCDRYLSKGSQVAIRGRIETGSYTNREGQKVYTTRVVADRYGGVEFLGSRSSNGGQRQGGYQNDRGGYGQNNGGFSQNNSSFSQGGQSFDNRPQDGFGGQSYQGGNQSFSRAQEPSAFDDPGFGASGQGGFGSDDSGFGGFDDMPDTFQAAEDDIPF